MVSDGDEPTDGLTPAEQNRLAHIRAATSLEDLVPLTDEENGHDAYLAIKREWHDLRGRELGPPPDPASTSQDEFPGVTVTVDGREYHVHGVTHADSAPEGDFLRRHVDRLLDQGASVYCEQGIRAMYFDAYPDVCQMDDYSWAMARCRERDLDSHVADILRDPEAGTHTAFSDHVDDLADRFQAAVYTLVESDRDLYGDEYTRALGDIAASFLMRHEDLATGDDFASYAISRRAAEDPAHLGTLQHYYERAFLPQPLERDWLRRHDPELEIVTHARNERMADYAVAHHDGDPLHVITGAAHQPGVRYYLEQHRDGHRTVADFEELG